MKSGTDVTVKTERPEFSLSLSEMELGSSVVFELPGFAKADAAKPQDSLDALRKASETSYFKDKDSLWVKVVVGHSACRAGYAVATAGFRTGQPISIFLAN